MLRVLFVLLCLTVPGLAAAGAWPRDEGKFFFALSGAAMDDGRGGTEGYQSLYGEYGLTPRLTFGIKLWRRQDGQHGDAMAFVSYPIGSTEGGHRFALCLGAGVRVEDDGGTHPILVPQFHWGKGFDGPLGEGWMSLSVEAGKAFGTADTWAKADFTFGLKPDDASHVILQLRLYDQPTGSVAYLVPSYVRELRKGMHVEAGMTYRLMGRDRVGLTLGSWLEF